MHDPNRMKRQNGNCKRTWRNNTNTVSYCVTVLLRHTTTNLYVQIIFNFYRCTVHLHNVKVPFYQQMHLLLIIKNVKIYIKISYIRAYMFRSTWTIVRELTLSLAKVARCTAPSTHTTTWNTCCHNTAKLITMYFYWLILQKCNFS